MSNYSSLSDSELNAAVAEQVMGKVPCSAWVRENLVSAGGPCWVLGGIHRFDNETFRKACSELYKPENKGKLIDDIMGPPCSHGKDGCYPTECALPYASSWDAMRLVVERMRELGYFCFLDNYEQEWEVEFLSRWRPENTAAKTYTAIAATAPRAVCVAACQAVEGQ